MDFKKCRNGLLTGILFLGLSNFVLADRVWLIGGNGTAMSCHWYSDSQSISIMTDQDRKALADQEIASAISNKRSVLSTSPRYLVCDTSNGNGIVVTQLGYPFMILGAEEFEDKFKSPTYIPCPTLVPDNVPSMIKNWGDKFPRVFNGLFVSDLTEQSKYDITITSILTTIIILLIFAVGVWTVFILKKIFGWKFCPEKRKIDMYPHVTGQSSIPMFNMNITKDSSDKRRYSDETIYGLPGEY